MVQAADPGIRICVGQHICTNWTKANGDVPLGVPSVCNLSPPPAIVGANCETVPSPLHKKHIALLPPYPAKPPQYFKAWIISSFS